jgi:CheY-like chemotaxis protein
MTTEPKLELPPPEKAKPPMQTWRILFLDSPENVELLKREAKDCGYAVVGATTIDEAWAFLEGKDHADVIVCAAHLRQDSMFEFLKGVRDSELHGDARFLLLSLHPGEVGARLDRSAASAGLRLGADAYLHMPVFDARELIAHIRQLQPRVPMLQQAIADGECRPQ